MDHLGIAAVNTAWDPAIAAVVEVGDGVAALRDPAAIRADRQREQHRADMWAHRRLSSLLNRAFPGVAIVSEEDAVHHEDRPVEYWLIDPIDGTASWSGGYAGYVCQVAFIQDGRVEFGAIHAPILGRTWTAARGHGAYVDGARLSDRRRCDGSPTVADNYPEPRGVCQILMEHLAPARYLESGSIGLKAALVAEGTADLFVKDVVVRDWDIAPALAVMTEVGGVACRADGSTYEFVGSYEKRDGVIFASDQDLAARARHAMAHLARHSAIRPA